MRLIKVVDDSYTNSIYVNVENLIEFTYGKNQYYIGDEAWVSFEFSSGEERTYRSVSNLDEVLNQMGIKNES